MLKVTDRHIFMEVYRKFSSLTQGYHKRKYVQMEPLLHETHFDVLHVVNIQVSAEFNTNHNHRNSCLPN